MAETSYHCRGDTVWARRTVSLGLKGVNIVLNVRQPVGEREMDGWGEGLVSC